jgi:hypothetical protein
MSMKRREPLARPPATRPGAAPSRGNRAGVEPTQLWADRIAPPELRRPPGLSILSEDVAELQRQYGNRAVQRLLARPVAVQRARITFNGQVAEGEGKQRKKVSKTIVVDTAEKNDKIFLEAFAAGRQLDSRAIDLLPEGDLNELDVRLNALGDADKAALSAVFKRIRTALRNRKSEREEQEAAGPITAAAAFTLDVAEKDEPKERVSNADQWAAALANLNFKDSVTDKFQLDHVLSVASAADNEAVDGAAKTLFQERLKGQPNLPESTLIVFDARAQQSAIAEVKAININLERLPGRGALFTTQAAYLMVTVKKSAADPSGLEISRVTRPFVFTTDQSNLWVQGPKLHVKAINHFERLG